MNNIFYIIMAFFALTSSAFAKDSDSIAKLERAIPADSEVNKALDLSDHDMRKYGKLNGTDLKEKLDFKKANLSKANFSGMSIENISFDNADLTEANFSNCNLVKVKFNNSKMDRVNFSGATLSSVSFEKSRAKAANFDRIDAQYVGFNNMDLAGSSFDSVQLDSVSFTRSIMDNVVLKNFAL